MKLKLSEPGYVVSGGVHLVALLLLIVTFAKPEQFDPMQETVPIETISDAEFNKVMQGDKSAPKVLPDATQKVDKVDLRPEPTPKPTAQADKTVPTPPPPPVQQPAEPPTPPTPPTPPVAEATPPPPAPTPPMPPARPTPAPSVPTPPQRIDTDAEAIAPKPVPTPPRPPEHVAEAKPMPPVKPHPVPKPPKVMPKPDQLAKLLDQDTEQPPTKPMPKAVKPVRPQPTPAPAQTADEPPQSHTFDLTDITKLLSHDEPAQKAATGRAPSRVASLGSPTAHADKMAPSLWGQLDGLMEEQYRQCWSYLGLNPGQKYVPQIRVTYDESGGLAAEPVLVNPPGDPALRALADSALRAVRRCNPLRIPAQYAPYYEEWKGRVLRFDPQEMAG